MDKDEAIRLLREIRSLCEEGFLNDKERLDSIHSVADNALYELER